MTIKKIISILILSLLFSCQTNAQKEEVFPVVPLAILPYLRAQISLIQAQDGLVLTKKLKGMWHFRSIIILEWHAPKNIVRLVEGILDMFLMMVHEKQLANGIVLMALL